MRRASGVGRARVSRPDPPIDPDAETVMREEAAASAISGADVSLTMPHHATGRSGGAGAYLLGKVGPIVAALAGIVAVWYLVSLVVLSPDRRFLLPPPHEVVANTLGNPNVMGPMLAALGQTVLVALAGLAIAVVLGLAYAVVMSQSVWAERVLYPYAVILQTIPILALVPLIGIWLGYGFPARIVVCVIIALFPMISNTLFGLLSASPAAHDLFTLNKATRWQRLGKLQFPAALPSIFTGLRNAAGLSVIGAIVGDFFFQQGSPGIGGLLRTYTLRLNMDALFMAIILTAVFGVVVFSIFAALDRAVIGRWYGHTAR
ncbi:binding-protein-dependent transport systems inner membrane component [Beutenbergia cavernae DSM 12333]|uniref:Binding-protein-dependent transport systems inner membrane component n=1 Tax=Beutenbergia cavernae (strain ATCC BAA-8 / DSM 12333 / CCUG 43141 / JCM 11478 / NBRC 16432 / NCIMB 13614 / HKI 0122) TaxID=471853 RepID=C5C4A6_BEUC1|nr:ABC transporter permease [Beutenbergia cavernae]ACQ82030.1 binding-protein-dependent transport systems inner membrane component [Beutenbergia cavernae DSM 12333]